MFILFGFEGKLSVVSVALLLWLRGNDRALSSGGLDVVFAVVEKGEVGVGEVASEVLAAEPDE